MVYGILVVAQICPTSVSGPEPRTLYPEPKAMRCQGFPVFQTLQAQKSLETEGGPKPWPKLGLNPNGLNPKPEALNPKTLNPKTLNPKPRTLNPKPKQPRLALCSTTSSPSLWDVLTEIRPGGPLFGSESQALGLHGGSGLRV